MTSPEQMDFKKPIFNYTDIELKSIGYDEYHIIQNAKQNLKIIETELQRRKLSNVIATVTPNELKK